MEDDRDQSPQPSVTDCESHVSGGRSERHSSPGLSLLRLGEEDRAQRFIKQRFVSSLGLQPPPEVVAVYRRNWLVPSAQATLLAFHIYLRAFATKNSGDGNVKFAWYGTAKDQIWKIIAHGFGHEEINRTSGAVYGRGIYLSPYDSPLASVQSTVEDEDGLRHVLLCKVLLGKVEAIQVGSDQIHPSSDRFDSGVDSVTSPKRYIMWSTNMNNILPEFIVSFRAAIDAPIPPIRRSPWMSFSALFQALSGFLNPHVMSSIRLHYKDFAEKRISRDELVRSIRRVAGDELLASIINSSNVCTY